MLALAIRPGLSIPARGSAVDAYSHADGILRRTAGWHGDAGYWRVLYTAGYATVPEDIQEACAQWVAHFFWKTKRDPGLASEAIPGTVWRRPEADMPSSVRTLLAPYRLLRV